ncbi:glycosyltransferase family 2 protein [Dyadobacter beijingensis]|nr:glycosyltransferase family 2 protein [Dyadobacter beijingensis]
MLNILIPTYNRAEFLIKNIEILNDIVTRGGWENEIDLIISDNASTDTTIEDLKAVQARMNLRITVYEHETNKGGVANCLFVLEKSTAKYMMYLGDDDYISYEYLSECMSIMHRDAALTAIVPNYVPVSVDGDIVANSRQQIGPTLTFAAGYDSVLENAWKGHQLSGLVFHRENLLREYDKYKVSNMYLFIFFVAISAWTGKVYAISQNPVLVTQPVKKKDWGYGHDGLVNDAFDNFKKLPVTYLQRFQLEFNFMLHQYWRFMMYKAHGNKVFFKALKNIAFCPNATALFTLSVPALLVATKLKLILK